MKRRGFTLIELLVVIAIIAILAAILFPVFAQAKAAAKKTQELSNVKNVTLGTIIYLSDSDDVFPRNPVYDWHNATPEPGWPTLVQPYLKSVGILRAPGDAGSDGPSTNAAILGPWISMAANALTRYGSDYSNTGIGLFSPAFPWTNSATGGNGQGWEFRSSTAVGRPAETVAFASRWNADFGKNNTDWGDPGGGMRSDFQPNQVFLFDDPSNPAWSLDGGGFCIGGIIPRGNRTKAATGITPGAYSDAKDDPYTRAGTVSSKYAGNGLFGFADGHAKATKPATTNPDPVGHPELNQWDATRS